jgi:hypothetical protein
MTHAAMTPNERNEPAMVDFCFFCDIEALIFGPGRQRDHMDG